MLKLYFTQGTCSLGIHLLLEEIGEPYEQEHIDFSTGEQLQPPYLEINPKGKIPALATEKDGVITEFPAIAFYLAMRFQQAKLLPKDVISQVRALEILDYATATVHMRGFTRVSHPGRFSKDGDPEAIRQEGMKIIDTGFNVFDSLLQGKKYALGAYSIADSALFFLETWAMADGLEIPPSMRAHYERMLGRPAAQRALKAQARQSVQVVSCPLN